MPNRLKQSCHAGEEHGHLDEVDLLCTAKGQTGGPGDDDRWGHV